MDWIITADRPGAVMAKLDMGGVLLPCWLGRGGASSAKQEGDGATPAGTHPLRRVMYRPDRLERPETGLPVLPLKPALGWCDDPASPAYNRLIRKPYRLSHEDLWRDDHLYDLIVEVAYNDAPPVSGKGSAIFIHLSGPIGAPTEGCVALRKPHLLRALKKADRLTRLLVNPD